MPDSNKARVRMSKTDAVMRRPVRRRDHAMARGNCYKKPRSSGYEMEKMEKANGCNMPLQPFAATPVLSLVRPCMLLWWITAATTGKRTRSSLTCCLNLRLQFADLRIDLGDAPLSLAYFLCGNGLISRAHKCATLRFELS